MKNMYREVSNKELLSDYKGIKEGKYYNLKHGKNNTSLSLAKKEIARRMSLGLMRRDATVSKKKVFKW